MSHQVSFHSDLLNYSTDFSVVFSNRMIQEEDLYVYIYIHIIVEEIQEF